MTIIYEDNQILVVEKPAGIPSQSSRITERDMVSEINNYLKKGAGSKSCPVFLIHRLDRNVAGLLVFAKNKNSAANINKQIQDGKMHKRYYALVSKKPEKSQDTLENFLIKDNGSNKALISNEDNRQAKKAILKYVQSDDYSAVEKYFPEYTENGEIKEGYTLLDIDLKTGRFHQIRCQLSAIGCPIVGDIKYGGDPIDFKDKICLVAYSLELYHPTTKKLLKF